MADKPLTILEQATKLAHDELDHVQPKELAVEATTDGAVEASINAPWKGFTVSAFVKAPIKMIKQTVAGFRLTKTFK